MNVNLRSNKDSKNPTNKLLNDILVFIIKAAGYIVIYIFVE